MERDYQRLHSTVGLSKLGFVNELATSHQFPRLESFCNSVVNSSQTLVIEDTLTHPTFANGVLTQKYGVRSYLGVPLITSDGFCIGTIAVMDLVPRHFSSQDIEFLELTVYQSMREFEFVRTEAPLQKLPSKPSLQSSSTGCLAASQLEAALLTHLVEEIYSPLTSVMGMASVLNHEIYGALTAKQKEYLGIISNSGHYLLSLVNQIAELLNLKDTYEKLNLVSVDVEMLCQQAVGALEQAAQRRGQKINLLVELNQRLWLLDKDKVKQSLYHLIFSVIQCSRAGSPINLHVSSSNKSLNIAVWAAELDLGDGRIEETAEQLPSFLAEASKNSALSNPGFLFSRQLIELQGGQIINVAPEAEYRYMISLPKFSCE
jgi:hypothetical protein